MAIVVGKLCYSAGYRRRGWTGRSEVAEGQSEMVGSAAESGGGKDTRVSSASGDGSWRWLRMEEEESVAVPVGCCRSGPRSPMGGGIVDTSGASIPAEH